LKSLLRYPGGKTRALKHIVPYFPKNLTEMVSPFFGGGSIEIHYASQGARVHGYDVFEPLVNFWQHVLARPTRLAHTLEGTLYPCSKENFKYFQQCVTDMSVDPWLRACMFYIINRCSFSGATLSGGMSPSHPRYTQSSIDRLRDFKCDNLTVKCASFEDSLRRHDDETFIYADPPYLLEKSTLYGERGSTHKDFDHHGFAEEIKKKNNWVISYNPHPEILELYKDYETVYPEWTYGMSSDKKSKEILILNVKGEDR
jgi:DNA adenine methylase